MFREEGRYQEVKKCSLAIISHPLIRCRVSPMANGPAIGYVRGRNMESVRFTGFLANVG